MADMSKNTRAVLARAAYARPTLMVYGSVRELTGGMSATGSDMMGQTNMTGV
ncbi:hypothetical protein GGQ88_001900 [Novosphingobium hassiacum]|uniref:Lasso RiPP family leader peptide-containing protein n=1 Tax=Novosphingobium hassiacum TaxID=173676 RepID=A0A7W5ZWP3_9SPHN|nr:hypothetical protein [Novosphingobium hassiacum]